MSIIVATNVTGCFLSGSGLLVGCWLEPLLTDVADWRRE